MLRVEVYYVSMSCSNKEFINMITLKLNDAIYSIIAFNIFLGDMIHDANMFSSIQRDYLLNEFLLFCVPMLF
jgi:hypothetical protein